MPTICIFRGITVFINADEHNPPHFHARYGGQEVSILINELELSQGNFPGKQLKMLIGWAALHQEELLECWNLATSGEQPYRIAPLS